MLRVFVCGVSNYPTASKRRQYVPDDDDGDDGK